MVSNIRPRVKLLNKEECFMKRIYNQPEVNVAQINTMSIICASGGAAGSGAGKVNQGVSTNDPW